MKITIEVPDGDIWPYAAAVLEVVEQGASGHSLSFNGGAAGAMEIHHHRLGVTVRREQ